MDRAASAGIGLNRLPRRAERGSKNFIYLDGYRRLLHSFISGFVHPRIQSDILLDFEVRCERGHFPPRPGTTS